MAHRMLCYLLLLLLIVGIVSGRYALIGGDTDTAAEDDNSEVITNDELIAGLVEDNDNSEVITYDELIDELDSGKYTVVDGDVTMADNDDSEVPSDDELTASTVAFMPKFAGLSVFDQAYAGARTAYDELSKKNNRIGSGASEEPGFPEELAPPDSKTSGNYQIDTIEKIIEVGEYDVILLSNNADDHIAETARAALENGIHVVTWDSPIPSSGVVDNSGDASSDSDGTKTTGESLFVAQVNFDETGQILADMAVDILGLEGGQFAILSAHRDAANQNAWIRSMETTLSTTAEAMKSKYENLKKVEIAYGNDDADTSYAEAVRLLETYPDLRLIVAPTTVGIVAASKAVRDLGKCETIKVTGLGDPTEMLEHTLSGCAPLFALWSFFDLGYLAYYVGHLLVTGTLKVQAGETFEAGRLGRYTIENDPSQDKGDMRKYKVTLGPFDRYDKNNIEGAARLAAIRDDGGRETFEERYFRKYKKPALALIPKFTGTISLMASVYIVWNVLASKNKRRQTSNRVLVGVALSGILISFFGFFLSTWPIPSDTWLVWGNYGTIQTCTMQGFFFQVGISATILYAGALTTVYMLSIVWKIQRQRLVQLEFWMHIFINLFAWGTAIAGLPLKLYNPANRLGFMCWIAEYPPYCSLRNNCQRGINAFKYRFAFVYAWVFIVFCYMLVCMILIYCRVLKTEKATDQVRGSANQSVIRRQSREVARQGLYYVTSFVIPWIFLITLTILEEEHYGGIKTNLPIGLEVATAILFPLGPFLNFLAYMRPASQTSLTTLGSVIASVKTTGQSSMQRISDSIIKHCTTRWSSSTRSSSRAAQRISDSIIKHCNTRWSSSTRSSSRAAAKNPPAVSQVADDNPKDASIPLSKNARETTEETKEEER